MEKLSQNSSVNDLSGVGPTRAKQLEKLGIKTLRDIVYNFPRMYEERGNVIPINCADLENSYGFVLTVATEVKTSATKKGLRISKFRAFDNTGVIEIIFFNSPYVKDLFHIGSRFRFWGKLTLSKNTLQLVNPKHEAYVDGIDLPDYVPVYSLTQGLSSKFVEKITKGALDVVLPTLSDPLPERIRLANQLPTLAFALKNIHFPKDSVSLKKAIRRLAFDEMLYFGIGISKAVQHKSKGEGVRFSPCDIKPIIELLPYELTNGQKNAINDVYRDTVLGKNGKITPMARIIAGDVGSGKTICAAVSVFIAAKSGYQSALMAPTEILARQHYSDISKLFENLGISVELLLGSTTAKEKKRIYNAISSGECDLVIGTHALITDAVSFASLGLIVTDEQHRFGVNQRAVLKDKTKSAHMLVMSATPIPRTLALTMYGDLDVSRITEMPKGRQRVDTFVVNEEYRSRLNDFINKQVLSGGQCYVVCPAIAPPTEEEANAFYSEDIYDENKLSSAKLNLKNVTEYTEKLKQSLPNISIECLHGKMNAKEKEEIMSRFSSGETSLLVSTTVIEVGVNVPNANLMVIENAERFGLSQLHQLRGRVGRGQRKSYCVLVNGIESEKARERLNVMKTTYDGFEIAEKDLILRGPGDFFAAATDSMRQSGGFKFKLASLCNDNDLFALAFKVAKEIVSNDPDLCSIENSGLLSEVSKFVYTDTSTIS